jgi:hypothetical protein
VQQLQRRLRVPSRIQHIDAHWRDVRCWSLQCIRGDDVREL